jgi:aminopeptidase N
MSTYLVAYVISDFKKIKKNSEKYNIEVEVAAKPESIENGDGNYALEQSANIIDFFTDYFEVNYPLSKSSNINNFSIFIVIIIKRFSEI